MERRAMRPGRGAGDAALTAAARRGDREAFGVLLRRHYPMVHALCARVLGDADDVLYTRARAGAGDPPLEDRLFTAFDPGLPSGAPGERSSG